MTYKRILIGSWLLTVILLSYNLCLWGGVAITPRLGDAVSFQAPRENILLGLYLSAGRQTVVLGGFPGAARRFAANQFGERFPDLVTSGGIGEVLLAQPWYARGAFYGLPILLVLSIFLQWLRPKQIRSLGG